MGASSARGRALRASADIDLRPGERLIAFYCHDAVECSCPATDHFVGVDTQIVARGGGVDRCVTCNATWPSKAHRDNGRRAPRGGGAGWLDDDDEAAA